MKHLTVIALAISTLAIEGPATEQKVISVGTATQHELGDRLFMLVSAYLDGGSSDDAGFDVGDGSLRSHWVAEGRQYTVQAVGQIVPSDDGCDVAHVSNGGRLRITERDRGGTSRPAR